MNALLLVHVLVIFSLAFLFSKKQAPFDKIFYWPALTLKLCAGIALGLIYKYYYTAGDTFGYFSDAVKMTEFARTDLFTYLRFLWATDEVSPLWKHLHLQQPRALFLSKFASVVALFSGGNYWPISLYFSFLSFLGAWYLYSTISRFFSGSAFAAALAFLFFPSVVFWTSGLIKESVAGAGLFYLSAIFLKVWKGERITAVQRVLILLSLWMLWNLKYYYLAVFLAVSAASLFMKLLIEPRVHFRNAFLKGLVWLMVFVVPLTVASLAHPNFYPERFLGVIVSNYEIFTRISDASDRIIFNNLEPSVGSILWHAPKALLSGLFRPFIWEAGNIFQLLTSLENSLLIILLVAALRQVRKLIRAADKMLLATVVLYVILLCVFLTLSTPNFGTLSRYRIGFLPYFILLVSAMNPITNRVHSFFRR